MIWRSGWVALSALVTGVVGCAYYNGLYNANGLAKDAARAEREGRPGEASALWAQAAVKAESVVARYPKSKHRDDALLLQGRALRASDQCPRALAPLHLAADSSSSQTIREHALLTLGQCRLLLGRPDSAIHVLSALVSSGDSAVARQARLWRGRAFMARADYGQAVTDLGASRLPEASFALAVAYSRLDAPDRAVAALEDRRRERYAERAWLSTLDSVGARYAGTASELVDGLAGRRDLTPGQWGRLLLADADRWNARHDYARAAARYALAAAAAPDSVEGRRARAELWLANVRLADDLESVGALSDSLRAVGPLDASPRTQAALRMLERLGYELEQDTVAGTDLRMFVTAERLRDSLDAQPLARALFREITERYPTSVLAPKALLAAAAMDAPAADSLLALLERRYPASPYALAVRGLGSDAFRALEDSLRTLLLDAELDPDADPELLRLRDDPDSTRQRRRFREPSSP